jgi:hypothetical protein
MTTIGNNLAVVADNIAGVHLVDYSNPASPTILGTYNTPGSAQRVAVVGTNTYVADGGSGLQILKVYTLSVPVPIANQRGMGWLLDIDVDGGYAYVASDDGTNFYLNVVDVSNPLIPNLLGAANHSGIQHIDIDIQGNYAYVAAYDTGLVVFNIADRMNPQAIGDFGSRFDNPNMYVDGIIGYINSFFGIRVLNVALPQAPTLITTIDNWTALDCMKLGNVLYVAAGFRMGAFNVTDPSNPMLITATNFYYSSEFGVRGNYLYTAAIDSGMKVLDISDPDTMVMAAGVQISGRCYYLRMLDHYAVVGSGSGLYIFDISDPANPVQAAHSDLARDIESIDIDGNYIYVLDHYSLMVFAFPATGVEDGQLAERFSLSQNYPNPFNAATTISYSLPSASDVNIDIFDIQGRKITTLAEGRKAAGAHAATWRADGISSGIYFYRLRAGDFSETRRMVLVK